MLQVKLITKSDIKLYKQLSETLNDDVIDTYILDAQIQDVAPLLGEKLFNALLKTPSEFEDLLNGGEYEVSGETYTNYGLKAVIAHYAYARYKMFGKAVDTPFGFVEKLEGNGLSTPESTSSKKTLYTLNRDSAYTIWVSVQNYLIRTDEPLFKSCYYNAPNLKRNNGGGFNLSSIKK